MVDERISLMEVVSSRISLSHKVRNGRYYSDTLSVKQADEFQRCRAALMHGRKRADETPGGADGESV